MENKLEVKTAKSLFARDDVKAKFQEMLGKRSTSFITSVLQIVASNDLLQKADPNSVYQSAAMAATLDLPLNNSLGFAYIVPYNLSVNENGSWIKKTVAQFQIGYKGFKQLALRSGQFLTIHSTDVREGEIVRRDRLTGEITFNWVLDEDKRESLTIVGYVSFFELINGYKQTFYMTRKKLLDHGKKYSQTFKSNKGLWVDSESDMMMKTVTKLNLSKNAPLSVDIQRAIVSDQAVIKDSDTLDVEYQDNTHPSLDQVIDEKENQRIIDHIDSSQTIEQLNQVIGAIKNQDQKDAFDMRMDELVSKSKQGK